MTIQLGLSGFETDIEQKSLTLDSVDVSDESYKQKSSNGTLHIDYLPTKRTFSLSYEVITKENFQVWEDYYNLQVSSLQPLSFKLEEADGVNTYSVYLPPISRGADTRDKPFYYGISITLEQR